MASVNETGHAKNIANLNEMIRRCIQYGAAYHPTNVWLQVMALQTKSDSAQAALAAAKDAKTAFANAMHARDLLFDKLRGLATRVVNAFEACGAIAAEVDDLKAVNRKLNGKRTGGTGTNKRIAAPAVPAPVGGATEGPGKHSVSQQSYDNLIEHFDEMIRIVTAEPLYVPNETDLQVSSLNTYLNDMKTAQHQAREAAAVYENALKARNLELYANGSGVVYLAASVKKYVKSLFGATSVEYAQISGLRFS